MKEPRKYTRFGLGQEERFGIFVDAKKCSWLGAYTQYPNHVPSWLLVFTLSRRLHSLLKYWIGLAEALIRRVIKILPRCLM